MGRSMDARSHAGKDCRQALHSKALTHEIWMLVTDIVGIYDVSSLGRLRRWWWPGWRGGGPFA